MYPSLYLQRFCVWEGVGDRTELRHIDPHSYGHRRCLFLVLQLGAGFLYRILWPTGLQTHWLPVFTELYNSEIAHSISLEWHVWSSSSGNNCHAVHRSLSSGASVYDCTIGFYLVPYCQPSPPRRFLPITAIGMCHFLLVHHFGMACLARSRVNMQHRLLNAKFIFTYISKVGRRPLSRVTLRVPFRKLLHRSVEKGAFSS